MTTDPNRILLTATASYSASIPQIGLDETHTVNEERKNFYQFLCNNIAYLYSKVGTTGMTANDDGFTITGGTTPRSFAVTLGSFQLTYSGAGAGATLSYGGSFITTGAGTLTFAHGAVGTTQTLPTASSYLVGATGGVLSVVAPAAGATLNVAGNLITTGAFNTTLVQGANVSLTLPTGNCTLASTANITGKKKTIRLPVTAFTKADGTALAKYSAANDGTVGIYGDGTKVLGLRWNNTAGATDTVAASFNVPADCDLTVAPVVKIRCAKVGATAADIPALTVGLYAQTDAAEYDAGANLGGSCAALANPATKTVQLASVVCTVFPGLTSDCTITVNPPAAQMTTDDLIITGVFIEYTPAVG